MKIKLSAALVASALPATANASQALLESPIAVGALALIPGLFIAAIVFRLAKRNHDRMKRDEAYVNQLHDRTRGSGYITQSSKQTMQDMIKRSGPTPTQTKRMQPGKAGHHDYHAEGSLSGNLLEAALLSEAFGNNEPVCPESQNDTIKVSASFNPTPSYSEPSSPRYEGSSGNSSPSDSYSSGDCGGGD